MKGMIKTILITLVLSVLFPLYADSSFVFAKINERLSYMQDVALYKAQHGLAVENKEREAVVIKKAKEGAVSYDLLPDSVEGFFVAQISAAKVIQYRYLADLQSNSTGLSKKPRDLKKVIRPELIRLGNDILQGINQTLKEGGFHENQRAEFIKILINPYLSESDANQLFDALLQIKLQ